MSYRALIVEDSPEYAALLRRILQRDGYESAIATNTQKARYMLDEESFDFVLLDLSLPAHSEDTNPLPSAGTDLLAHIRERFDSSVLPVIMMTAYERSSQTGVELMKAGADDYFSKGDTTVSAERKIREMVGSIQKHRALQKSGKLHSSPSHKRHHVAFQEQNVMVNEVQIDDERWVAVFLLLRRLTARSGQGMTAAKLADGYSKVVQPNTVTAWIKQIRDYLVAEHLARGIEIGRNDVVRTIRAGRKGYQLNSDLCSFSFD